jgi:hypothetical protein
MAFDLKIKTITYFVSKKSMFTVSRGNCLSFRQLRGCCRSVLADRDCAQNPCLEIDYNRNVNTCMFPFTLLNQNHHVDIENFEYVVMRVIVYKMMGTMKELIYNNLF